MPALALLPGFLRNRAGPSISSRFEELASSAPPKKQQAKERNDLELMTLQRAICSRIEPGRPHIVQFQACDVDDPASTAARSYAEFVAANVTRRTLLLDAWFGPAELRRGFSLVSSWLGAPDVEDAILPDLVVHGLFHARLADRGQVSRLSSNMLCQSLADLSRNFATIVIDAACPVAAPEVLALMPAISGVVVVVRSGSTRVQEIRQVRRWIEVEGGNMLGAVFTDAASSRPSWLRRWQR